MGRVKDYRPLYLACLFHHKHRSILTLLSFGIPSSLWKMVAVKPFYKYEYIRLSAIAGSPRSHSLLRIKLSAIFPVLKFHSSSRNRSNNHFPLKTSLFHKRIVAFLLCSQRTLYTNSLCVYNILLHNIVIYGGLLSPHGTLTKFSLHPRFYLVN